MKTYSIYIKSHAEAPDYEASFSEIELKNGHCLIPYAEPEEDEEGNWYAHGVKCGGKLIPFGEGGFKCTSCEVIYVES